MKKILCLVLSLLMIWPLVVSADISGEIGYSASAQNVYIAGDLSKAEKATGNEVTILLTDKTTGDIKYVEQLKVADDKTYEAKFKFKDNISNCELSIKEGDNLVNSSVTVASVSSPTVYSLTLRDENESHVIEKDELVKATAEITNKYGDGGKYKILAAFYGENNKLLDCQTLTDGSFTFYDIEKQISGTSTITVPSGTKEIKAFMWNDTQNIIPLTEEQVRTASDKKFGGDTEQITVAFIGDSITHGTQYLKGIEHYYHTRYPNKDIVFVNKGISGNYASSVVSRFNWDIAQDEISGKIDEACIMIGMNDVERNLYNVGSAATLESKNSSIKACVDNVERIILACRNAGISLTIITPSAYDDTEGFTDGTTNQPECNTYGLKNIATKLTALADRYNIPVIDFWTPTTKITDYVRETYGYEGSVIAGTDRIHPDELGGTFMAYQFIKQQDGNPIIAKVEIDAKNGTKTTENADVNLTSASTSKVEYEYLPKAIPFAYTTNYKQFEDKWDVPITKDINQEIIKVTGLDEGTYTITIGSNTLAEKYTAAQLAEGVNIAIDENNPAQIQAQTAYAKAKIKVSNEGTYRSIAITEQQLKSKGLDESQFNENSTEEELKALGAWTGNFKNYFSIDESNYGSKKYEEENWTKIRAQEQDARNAAKPVQRTVVIVKL